MFATSEGGSGSSILPNVFQEDTACAQICPNLTFNQRVIGFLSCAALGWVLSFIGTLTLIGGPTPTNIRTFIVLYILGTVFTYFFCLLP
jgi:hypothetical protein